VLAASAAERRFASINFEAFATVALALAATGIYGVLSGSVNERIREIGIRCALGASPRTIVSQILREALAIHSAGIIVGLTIAGFSARAIGSLLFRTSVLDWVTYASVIVLLTIVSAVACCLPALRAARVDPSVTLRMD